MNRTLVLAAIALSFVSCDSSMFYVEADESQICREVDGIGPWPAGAPVQTTVTNDFTVPLGDALPTFDAKMGSMDLRVLNVTFTPGNGLTDFNGFDSAKMTLIPPDGSNLPAATLLTYTKGATPAGTSLILEGEPNLNVFPYLQNGDLGVHAELTGTFPTSEWYVNVDPCLSVKVRLNYANLITGSGADAGM